MTYSESAEGVTITRERAKQEIAEHGGDPWELFLEEVSDSETYQASTVLEWLGY